MGTKTWVLLNSPRVAHEIIANRAGLTHERPYFPISSGIVSRDKRVFLHRTDKWRVSRRRLHNLIMGVSSKNQMAIAEEASLGLLRAYLDKPRQWYEHNYRYSVAIIHEIVADAPLHKSTQDLSDLQRVTSTFLTSINSSFVEFFPQLTYLPVVLQRWRPHWESLGAFHFQVFRYWWAGLKDDTAANPEPTFVRHVAQVEYADDEDQAMFLVMFVISAGSDNPRMAANALIMACLSYPEAMKRAQREIDQVCGADANRLPGHDDLASLPYVCAMLKEVLRWRPVVPLLPQRVLVEDLEVDGYRFPAGTEFLVNSIPVCYAGHDSPGKFEPERWLDGSTGERPSGHGGGVEQNLWEYAFNAGRRSCIGYKLAQKELFISFARLLYCFDIVPAGAFDDRELNPFSPGEPFPAQPRIRSEAHERLVRAEATSSPAWDADQARN